MRTCRVVLACATDETKLWLSPSAKHRRNPWSESLTVFQDLRTRYDWPVKKAFVDWPIRLKGNTKRISGKSMSPLWAQTRISALLRRRCWPKLNHVDLRLRCFGWKIVLRNISHMSSVYSCMASTLIARPFIAYREAFLMGPYDI